MKFSPLGFGWNSPSRVGKIFSPLPSIFRQKLFPVVSQAPAVREGEAGPTGCVWEVNRQLYKEKVGGTPSEAPHGSAVLPSSAQGRPAL